MKYWFYADGNILGPYAPAELLSMPAFGQGSLVCPETSGGDNPGDWRPAEDVCEIAEALSVGVGSVLPGQYGSAAGSYEPSGPASAYYEAQNGPADGYGNLLDTIDNILGAYKESGGPSEVKLPPDFDLMNNFDIRLSKIQEELEAARWEKNLLLEKMRSRDSEERKNKELIADLEDKLREALKNAARQEQKSLTAGAVQHLPAVTEADRPAAGVRPVPEAEPPADKSPAAGPSIPKKLRSIRDARLDEGQPGGFSGGSEAEALTVKPLLSAGRSPASGGDRFSATVEAAVQPQQPGPEAAGPGAGQAMPFVPGKVNSGADAVIGTYTPQGAKGAGQTPGADYDFSAIARPSQEAAGAQLKILPVQAPPPAAKPSAQEIPSASPPQPQEPASSYPMFPAQPGQAAQTQVTTAWFNRQADAAHSQGAAETIPAPNLSGDAASPKDTVVAIGKQTERIPLAFQNQKEDLQKSPVKPVKGRRKMGFILTLLGFACVAVLGLVLFFFSGGSFSEFSMQSLGGGKTQDASGSDKPGSQPADGEAALSVPEGQQTQAGSAVKPAFEAASNENTSKAIETVKAYKLSGGRGTVEVWFANSFLSGSASGSNEEWSATILHGDIFLVQYRLLRPKQEPLSYEFEVDVTKGVIVRGINNNAMELLESSAAPAAKLKPAKARKSNARRPKKSGEIALLPLPEPTARAEQGDTPTGFETADLEGNEKVKYIVAQESDEELF
jgi:hypothetical protein